MPFGLNRFFKRTSIGAFFGSAMTTAGYGVVQFIPTALTWVNEQLNTIGFDKPENQWTFAVFSGLLLGGMAGTIYHCAKGKPKYQRLLDTQYPRYDQQTLPGDDGLLYQRLGLDDEEKGLVHTGSAVTESQNRAKALERIKAITHEVIEIACGRNEQGMVRTAAIMQWIAKFGMLKQQIKDNFGFMETFDKQQLDDSLNRFSEEVQKTLNLILQVKEDSIDPTTQQIGDDKLTITAKEESLIKMVATMISNYASLLATPQPLAHKTRRGPSLS